ncbi:MAG: hypothetical protein WBQ95_03625, partial [Terracidiphilus sp.]
FGITLFLIGSILALGTSAGRAQEVPKPYSHFDGGLTTLDGKWSFHLGDDMTWASPGFDDSGWEKLSANQRAAVSSTEPAEQIALAAERFGQDDDITILTLTRLAIGENQPLFSLRPSWPRHDSSFLVLLSCWQSTPCCQQVICGQRMFLNPTPRAIRQQNNIFPIAAD